MRVIEPPRSRRRVIGAGLLMFAGALLLATVLWLLAVSAATSAANHRRINTLDQGIESVLARLAGIGTNDKAGALALRQAQADLRRLLSQQARITPAPTATSRPQPGPTVTVTPSPSPHPSPRPSPRPSPHPSPTPTCRIRIGGLCV